MILWFIEMSQAKAHSISLSSRPKSRKLIVSFRWRRMKVEDWFWVDTKTSRRLIRCFLLPNTWSQEENQNDFFIVLCIFLSLLFLLYSLMKQNAKFWVQLSARGTRVAITIGFVVIMCPNVHNHWMLWESESMKRRNLPGEDSEMR